MKYWSIRLLSVVLAVGGCLLLDYFATHNASSFAQRLILLAGLYVTLSVSLNLINGITGQFSIGHAAFYQVGAYTTGVLATNFFEKAHLPGPAWMVLMMIAGALVAAVAGLLVGMPSLRLRGDYLAVVTLGFGEIINIIAKNQESLGKAYGMNVTPRFQYIWLVWLLAIVCIACCRNLLKNVHGLSFLAVREDEIASSAMGVNVTVTKVTAFVLGSAFAGAAGALLAHNEGFISPAMFRMDTSFIILTMVVLGGTGSITGSVLSALVLFYIPEKMRDLQDVRMAGLVAAAIAIIAVVAVVKRILDHYYGPTKKKALYIACTLLGGVVVQLIFSAILKGVPAFGQVIEGSKLRLVVFAATLVVLMLIRPQGIFAHHEFSWSWVKRLLGRKDAPKTAVSA